MQSSAEVAGDMANSVQSFLGGATFASTPSASAPDAEAALAFVTLFDAAALPAAPSPSASSPAEEPGAHLEAREKGLSDSADASAIQPQDVLPDQFCLASASLALPTLPHAPVSVPAGTEWISQVTDLSPAANGHAAAIAAEPVFAAPHAFDQTFGDDAKFSQASDPLGVNQTATSPVLFGAAGIRPAGTVIAVVAEPAQLAEGAVLHSVGTAPDSVAKPEPIVERSVLYPAGRATKIASNPAEGWDSLPRADHPLVLPVSPGPSAIQSSGPLIASKAPAVEARNSDPRADRPIAKANSLPDITGAGMKIHIETAPGTFGLQPSVPPAVLGQLPESLDVLPVAQVGTRPSGFDAAGSVNPVGNSVAALHAAHMTAPSSVDPPPYTKAATSGRAPPPAEAFAGKTQPLPAVTNQAQAGLSPASAGTIAQTSGGRFVTPMRANPLDVGRHFDVVPQLLPKPGQGMGQIPGTQIPGVQIPGTRPSAPEVATIPDPDMITLGLPDVELKVSPAKLISVMPEVQVQPVLSVSNDTIVTDADEGVPALVDHDVQLAGLFALPKPDFAAAMTVSPQAAPQNSTAPVPVAALPQALAAAAGANRAQSVNLQLDPIELGTVAFNMETGPAGLVVTIVAERPETLELLRRHADQFLADLRQSGFQGASLQFGPSGQGPSGQSLTGQGQWGQGQNGQNGQPQTHGQSAPEYGTIAPQLANQSLTPRSMQMGGLNLRL